MPHEAPPSACAIFYRNDEIFAQFTLPNSGQTGQVSFRNDPRGHAALARFLQERAKAFDKPAPPLFGTPAVPIQHIVNSWHLDPKAQDKAAKAAERAEAQRFKSKPAKEQLAELDSLFDTFDF
jgi:hypothetical protein